MQTNIPYNRHTIKPGDTGHPPGQGANIGARWTEYTSPNTPRLKWDGTRGRYFLAGERWKGVHMLRPTDTPIGRHINWHDTPVPGVGWPSDVSPVAIDINIFAESLPAGQQSNADTLSIQYGASCPGHGSHKHTIMPYVFGGWNFVWWDILWQTNCTGAIKLWLTNANRGASLGALVDYTNIRTIKDDTGLGDSVMLWQGAYKTGYSTGADGVIDITGGHVGATWQDVWNDVPQFLSTWGSNLSSIVLNHGTLNVSEIIVPNDIAAEIEGVDPPDPPPDFVDPSPPAHYFGFPTTGASRGNLSIDAIRGGAFQASENLLLDDIRFRSHGSGTSAQNVKVKGVLYGMSGDPSSGGEPTARLGTTNESLIADNSADAWTTLTFSVKPNVTAGNWYFLALHVGTTTGLETFFNDTGGHFRFKSAQTYTNGPPDPWGASNDSNARKLSIIASGTVQSPPSPPEPAERVGGTGVRRAGGNTGTGVRRAGEGGGF